MTLAIYSLHKLSQTDLLQLLTQLTFKKSIPFALSVLDLLKTIALIEVAIFGMIEII